LGHSEISQKSTGVWALYRQSLKPADSLFNLYFARPLAAPIVYLLSKTRVTPNQVTFVSTLVMILAVTALSMVSGYLGVLVAVVGIELSYVLDCVDGQLARVTGRSSAVGGDLDFMMDELKAYLLIVALGIRGAMTSSGVIQGIGWGETTATWRGLPEGPVWPLVVCLLALLVTASAISLTRFIRSERYAEATGAPVQKHGQSAGEGRGGGPLWPLKALARLVTQYPASLPLFALAGALDIFVYAYGILHALYAGQAGLGVVLKLGRFAPQDKPQRVSEDEENG
jgi:phosphatidylglycerophosphate synthase